MTVDEYPTSRVLEAVSWEGGAAVFEPPEQTSFCEPCRTLLREAHRELGVFMVAIAGDFGHEVALNAAQYWIECLKRVAVFPEFHEAMPFPKITCEVAERLACELVSPRVPLV